MVSFQEARKLVMAQVRSFGVEEVALDMAPGRVLAEPVRADRDYPPFNRATMDGYALRYGDLERGIREFKVAETLFAGAARNGVIGSGECYKIMTGAAVPEDADLVIRREDVREGRGDIAINEKDPEPWRSYLNIARQGEDLRTGELVFGKPCRCNPAVVGLLASLGYSKVAVARRPRIAIVTTGNEIVEPGEPVGRVAIRNSNRWMLEAALQAEGVFPVASVHVRDDPGQLKKAILALLPADVLIMTGGVSAGDADHVPAVLEEIGVKKVFHKVGMRPGKPGYCGLLPGGEIVFGLPGNPFSCLVHFAVLIGPYLRVCWGLDPGMPLGLPIGEERTKRTPLDEFFPVLIVGSPATAKPTKLNGSGDIRLGLEANALARHPAGQGNLAHGDFIECYPLQSYYF